MPLPLLAAAGIMAGAGALGGLLGRKKKPPRYNPLPGYYQQAFSGLNEFGEDVRNVRGFYNDAMDGGPVFSTGQRDMFLNPGRGIAAGQADLARRRAGERAVGLGVGPRSGQYEATMGEIDRSELAANRGAYANFANQEALMSAQRQTWAAQMLQNLLNADLGHRTDEAHLQYNAKAARSQTPSTMQSVLGGAVNGFMSGLGGGLMGGMGGGGGATSAMAMMANPSAQSQFPAYSPSWGYNPQVYYDDPWGYLRNEPIITPRI